MAKYPRRAVHMNGIEALEPQGYVEQTEEGGQWSCPVAGRRYPLTWSDRQGDRFLIDGIWIETFDHHPAEANDKDAGGMYVSEKKPADVTALVAELRTQLQQAWQRLDYKTADRIADLIGEQRTSVHEGSNT